MDKKLILVFIIGLIFLGNIVIAEPILILNYAICKNDSVSINSIKYTADGTVKIYESASSEYRLKSNNVDNKTIAVLNIPVSFYLFTEPPKNIDCSIGYQRLPWENETKYINFYHNDNLIKDFDIAEYIFPNAAAACNRNNVCEPEKGENNINCSEDCSFSNNADTSWFLTLFAMIAISAMAAIILYFRRKKENKLNVKFED